MASVEGPGVARGVRFADAVEEESASASRGGPPATPAPLSSSSDEHGGGSSSGSGSEHQAAAEYLSIFHGPAENCRRGGFTIVEDIPPKQVPSPKKNHKRRGPTFKSLGSDAEPIGDHLKFVSKSKDELLLEIVDKGPIHQWAVPGQNAGVIHRPSMKAKLTFVKYPDKIEEKEWGLVLPSQQGGPPVGTREIGGCSEEGSGSDDVGGSGGMAAKSVLQLPLVHGYSKRYWGDYPRYWAYHFMIHSGPERALGTADARFGDDKYNYFKVFGGENALALAAPTCYHQGDRAYGREGGFEGRLHRLEISRVLCSRRVIIGGGTPGGLSGVGGGGACQQEMDLRTVHVSNPYFSTRTKITRTKIMVSSSLPSFTPLPSLRCPYFIVRC